MRRRSCFAVLHEMLLLAGIATVAHAVPSRSPLAVVAEFSGRVDVVRTSGKRAEPVALGLPLQQGDRLQVGQPGSATLLFNDGNVLELPAKSTLTIGGSSGKKTVGRSDELMAGVFQSVSQSVVGGSRETGLVALAPVRGSTNPSSAMILAPRQTEIFEDRPTFRWRSVNGAGRYRAVVSSDAGKLWEREVTDTSLAYPADAPALARDADFVWELSALGNAGMMRQEQGGFHVKSEAEAASIRQHLERIEGGGAANGHARDYLAGAYLAGQGLLLDASQRFEALCASHPDEPGPHEALGRIYRAVGLTDEAATELQKALTLTRKP